MGVFQPVVGAPRAEAEILRRGLRVVANEPLAPAPIAGLMEHPLPDLEALVITKTAQGFDDPTIERLRAIVQDVANGRMGPPKFLVFDFAHEGEASANGGDAFQSLVAEVANLILHIPIVLVANARGPMAGADLEFALACTLLIGEAGAQFSFAADPIVSIATYGFLAQKIGFVRAERLMEGGGLLDAEQMHDLLLLKAIAEAGAGLDGVRSFLTRTAKRYNSCYSLYRAHRMASPIVRVERQAYG